MRSTLHSDMVAIAEREMPDANRRPETASFFRGGDSC